MTAQEMNPGKLLEISGNCWKSSARHAGVKFDVFTAIGDKLMTVATNPIRISLKMFCLTVLLLAALFFSGCASTQIHSAEQSLWDSADEAAAIDADNGGGTGRLNPAPSSPDTDGQSVSDLPSTQAPITTGNLAEEEVFNEFEKEFGDVTFDTRKKDVYDPLGGYNRFMFNINDKLYFWILKPVARGYGAVIPEGGRVALNRFFKNLSFPVRFVNNALQGKLMAAGVETARFAINTTIGLLGLFDPADEWYSLKPYEEDFGQTLGHYGAGDGFPLQLPLLGPSNLRDTVGIVPDTYLHPIDFLSQGSNVINPIFLGVFILDVINKTSLRIGVYENFKKEALDPYSFMRDAYKQNRDARVKE